MAQYLKHIKNIRDSSPAYITSKRTRIEFYFLQHKNFYHLPTSQKEMRKALNALYDCTWIKSESDTLNFWKDYKPQLKECVKDEDLFLKIMDTLLYTRLVHKKLASVNVSLHEDMLMKMRMLGFMNALLDYYSVLYFIFL
jgi:hypothetical protein